MIRPMGEFIVKYNLASKYDRLLCSKQARISPKIQFSQSNPSVVFSAGIRMLLNL